MLDNVNAQLQQAYALIKQGQKVEALQVLRPILSRQPNNAEGWWLAAHAAPTEKDAAYACAKVLALRPDYAPARQMVVKQNLKDAAVMLYNKEKPQALALIKAVIEQQPDSIDGWWLMANAAPSTVDAVLACQKVLALQPGHVEARTRLLELQHQSAKALAEKYHRKDTKPRERKTRWWRVFGLTGLIIMILTGALIATYLTGRNFGLPIGKLFSLSRSLGTLGEKPMMQTGTLVEGATHEYHFHIMHPNSQVMLLVQFASGTSNPSKTVKLVGPGNSVIPIGGGGNVAAFTQVTATLPTVGDYNLILTGTPGGSTGAYVMEIAAAMNMPDMSQFQMDQP